MNLEETELQNDVHEDYDAEMGVRIPKKGKRGYTEHELDLFMKDLELTKKKIAAAKRDIALRKRQEATRLKIKLGGEFMKRFGKNKTFEEYQTIMEKLSSGYDCDDNSEKMQDLEEKSQILCC